MAQFENGHSLGKGRPEGSANKVTKETRAKMSEVLTLAIEEIKKRLKDMKDRELIEAATLLAKHTVPIPKEDNADGTTDTHIKFTGKLLQ